MLSIGRYKIEHPYILAPMAGVSQMPFRRLALSLGAGLAPTELISAKGLSYGNLRTKSYLAYDQKVERPFCVQLFGGEVDAMAIAAAQAMKMGAEIIDINMGCPVKKVTKTNAGSALMCDYPRAQNIIKAMRKATEDRIPITAKIRSGWDSNNMNYLEVARALEESGAQAVAIHPRTRAQAYSGKANWDHIAELKAHLKIPVIGNGDVKNVADAQKMFVSTRCDAVMIGRAALGNPWIFRELSNNKFGVSSEERLTIVHKHLKDHIELRRELEEEEGVRNFSMNHALKCFRSHLMWYSVGLEGSSKFRQKVMTTDDYQATLDLIEEFFSSSKNSHVHSQEDEDDGIDYRQAFG
ncbi:MAG: tRNA dihydrouridine synthase DusB [Myxococcales bacterium]|nr:tRNA dihydrouridine synthase DusB [Myxococcales bacterium]USN51430.1 MAG: tRNA dihydrouridine synthase DusB [Myxococcales bacterium]